MEKTSCGRNEADTGTGLCCIHEPVEASTVIVGRELCQLSGLFSPQKK